MIRLVSVCIGMVALGGGSAAVFAQPAVPDQCKDVSNVPADAKIPGPGLAAKIALATCGAEVRMSALKLTPDDASIQALTAAAQPSLDALSEIIKGADGTYSTMATKLRADIYSSMAVRMRNSIPPITMDTVGQALADHDKAHTDLEPKLKPWLDAAQAH
ncbi:MAG TPA: hypothetical protein VGF94_24840 [Kofleriaceae bacterium]